MKHTAFNTYHPIVAAIYLMAALVFAMVAFQPVFIALNLCVAVAYNVYLRGWRAALKTAAWQLPLLLIIALLNPIFTSSGSTLILKIGHRGIYLESLLYGIFMGLTLITVMQWFSNLSHILTSDKIMQLTGSTMPTIGLMITMILRLVPQFISRNSAIRTAQEVCTSAKIDRTGAELDAQEAKRMGFFQRKAQPIKGYLRDISVLMGWALEDSLDTSEAMRARGWGAAHKRSTYQRNDFKLTDGIVMAIMLVLIAGSAFLAIAACSQFDFYPQISHLRVWWGYIPFLLFLLIPFVLELKERIAWKS